MVYIDRPYLAHWQRDCVGGSMFTLVFGYCSSDRRRSKRLREVSDTHVASEFYEGIVCLVCNVGSLASPSDGSLFV